MDILDTQEAANFLHCTPGTLYHWCSDRKVPHMNSGKKLLFDRAQLEEWLRSKRVLTDVELQQKAIKRG